MLITEADVDQPSSWLQTLQVTSPFDLSLCQTFQTQTDQQV